MRISKLFRRITSLMAGAIMTVSMMVPSAVMAEEENSMNVALCVYGLTSTAAQGQPIEITGEGQYTVEFDCDAYTAESIVLKDFVALYIADTDVLAGNASASPVETCNIVYDAITVDGKELTIVNKDAKSAVKASGIFDTNDPINGWDGSVVAEEEIVWDKNAHTVAFAGNDAAKKVSVTFTLSDIKWKEAVEETEAETVEETEAETEAKTEAAPTEAATTAAAAEEKADDGMSTGVIIGIVAAVVVVIIVIVAISLSKKKKVK